MVGSALKLRWLIWAVLSGTAAGQIFLRDPEPLIRDAEFAIPASLDPRLLVIEGRREEGGLPSAEVMLSLDGVERGPLSSFSGGGRRCRAVLALPPSQGRSTLVCRATEPGWSVGPIYTEPAGVLRVRLVDEATSALVPGVVDVVSVDGSTPPDFGSVPWNAAAGSRQFLPTGEGEVFVPAEKSVELLAFSHPFRRPASLATRMAPGQSMPVEMRLGTDLRSLGSRLVDRDFLTPLSAKCRDQVNTVFGISDREGPGYRGVLMEGDRISRDPKPLYEYLLRPQSAEVLLSGGSTPEMVSPLGPRVARTVRIPGPQVLYSNGPVLHRGLWRRVGTQVHGSLQVRFDETVEPAWLRLRLEDRELVVRPILKPGTERFELTVGPDQRVLAIFEGQRFSDGPLAGPAPFAAMVLTMPE